PRNAAFTARRSRVSTSLSASSCRSISGANSRNTASVWAVGAASLPPAMKPSPLMRSTSFGGKFSGSWNDRLRTWYSSPSIALSRSLSPRASAPRRAVSDAGAARSRSSSWARTLRIVITAVVTALTVARSRCRKGDCGGGSARPRPVLVLEGVGGEDAVDLHAVGDASLLEAVGPLMLHTVATGAVRRRERILPATEAPDQPASRVEDVEPHVLVLVLEPVIDHRAAR